MIIKNKMFLSFTLLFNSFLGVKAQQTYPFQNPNLTMEQRVDNVISLLTLEEKVAFILGYKVPRLNIVSPGSAEGIHQALVKPPQMGAKPIPTTSFSQVYGMGATWNPEIVSKINEAYKNWAKENAVTEWNETLAEKTGFKK